MLDFTQQEIISHRLKHKHISAFQLALEPNKSVYAFLGENGVGKTVLLETLRTKKGRMFGESKPVIYINTQHRGHLKRESPDTTEQWILKTAQLANPFQASHEQHKNKIKTFLQCLHSIDSSYDPNFLEIQDDSKVVVRVNGQEKKLGALSTGFLAILKIIQRILSKYESDNPLETEGVVLIDEIESHLHLKWQAYIIPKLKELFPNTTFIIATHSPIVISQLEEGEAYKLVREDDGVVRSKKIENPRSNAMIDLLNDAFDIDMNEIAIKRPATQQQHSAKQELLNRIKQRKVAQ